METLYLALRVAVALAAVLGLIWFVQRKLTGKGGKKGAVGARFGSKRAIQVVGTHRLAAKASIALVEVEGQKMVLGVTEHGISVLETTTPAAEVAALRQELAEKIAAEEAAVAASPVPSSPAPAPAAPPASDFAAALRAAEAEVSARPAPESLITMGLRPTELAPAPRRTRGRLEIPELAADSAAAARPGRVAMPGLEVVPRSAPLATPVEPARPAPERDDEPMTPALAAAGNPTFIEALGPAFKQVVASALGKPAARREADLTSAVPLASKLPVLRRAS